jgi:hypothetical protein
LAERSQNLALKIGRKFNALVGDIEMVKDLNFEEAGFMSSFGGK